MPDGIRLWARIWLPEDAEDAPVPTILEYIPYRKDDATAVRDAGMHPYFADHGYAAVRVDIRGSGDSEGILEDEYLPREQEDGVEVIRWLAAQSWCTGAVGMIGKSWGGFNSLQIAAHAPPELQAVISVCSTDDRYADDVHYMGGCVFASFMLSWASTMLAFNARPPDPAVVGERWRELWLDRLEKTPPFVEAWLSHQRRDAYWKQGSACEDYGAIRCPVYMVGGWADGYPNALLRFLAGYPGPRKGLIGPWGHLYPHDGLPGPAIGFLQECLRWFDHWLKGVETGIMEEPLLRAWMHEAVPPGPSYAERPGRWVAEPAWRSPALESQRFALTQNGLEEEPGEPVELVCGSSYAHGLDGGSWIAWGTPVDFARDQRAEDGRALCFTSAPLEQDLELLGHAELALTVASDRPNALVAARLCDVWPDGASTLVTFGVLNLTHRESHERPSPVIPDRPIRLTLRLDSMAYAFPAGHRIRLALSPTLWPWVWPSPEPVTLTVFGGDESALLLPVCAPRPEDSQLPRFEEPEGPPPLAVEMLGPGEVGRTLTHDVATGRWKLAADLVYFGSFRIVGAELEHRDRGRDTFTIVEGDPLSAEARSEWSIELGRGDWRTRVETLSTMTADAGRFCVTNAVDAYEGDVRIFAKTWHFSVPRDLV
ncbi:MAG: CocE/NonD family hydrolase [Actinobacteria bacterium]|nr:CocE/NonD family hydrolase [Actinomycetota bacterium]